MPGVLMRVRKLVAWGTLAAMTDESSRARWWWSRRGARAATDKGAAVEDAGSGAGRAAAQLAAPPEPDESSAPAGPVLALSRQERDRRRVKELLALAATEAEQDAIRAGLYIDERGDLQTSWTPPSRLRALSGGDES